eukprot:gene13268-9111_t
MSHIGEYTSTNASLETALIPSTEAAKEYINPVQDDTWVRHAELVRIDDLKETEYAAEVREELLRDHQAAKKNTDPDPVMEGMAYQEKFMSDYKNQSSRQDKVKASSYKDNMIKNFRRRREGQAITEAAQARTGRPDHLGMGDLDCHTTTYIPPFYYQQQQQQQKKGNTALYLLVRVISRNRCPRRVNFLAHALMECTVLFLTPPSSSIYISHRHNADVLYLFLNFCSFLSHLASSSNQLLTLPMTSNEVAVADNNQDMQLQVYDMSNVLSMPKEEFVEFFLQPVQDDTWIRQEDIVKIEEYLASEEGEEVKKEILKEYIEKRNALGIKKEDKVLEGMAYQEKVMEDYLVNDQEGVTKKVVNYRQFIMSNFRRRHPDYKPTPPFGEEEYDEKKENPSDDDEKDKNSPSPAPAEEAEAAPAEEEAPAEAAPAEEEAPAEEAPADCNIYSSRSKTSEAFSIYLYIFLTIFAVLDVGSLPRCEGLLDGLKYLYCSFSLCKKEERKRNGERNLTPQQKHHGITNGASTTTCIRSLWYPCPDDAEPLKRAQKDDTRLNHFHQPTTFSVNV